MKRKPITPTMRFAVLSRDGFRCRYCGAVSRKKKLVIDHLIPVSKGGITHIDNLVSACRLCNSGKSNKILKDAPAEPDTSELQASLQEQYRAAQDARNAAELVRREQNIVIRFWLSLSGKDEIDRETFGVVFNYYKKYGSELVFSWITLAFEKCAYDDDDSLGRYVSGCRRRYLSELEEAQAPTTQPHPPNL